MRSILAGGIVTALLGSYGCQSTAIKTATADALPSVPDVKVASDVSSDLSSPKPDAKMEPDVSSESDVRVERDVASTKSDAGVDASSGVLDVNAGAEVSSAKTDTAAIEAGTGTMDTSEQCSCGSGSSTVPSALSWTCFCSIENCGRKIADFVDVGDGGRTLRNQTVLLSEYADCNLVFIKHRTYSDYVPPSEYVFDRRTGVLIGAKVELDDREHLCPFPPPDGSTGWVFSYQAGSYPIPSTCARSACLGSASACATAGDAG